MGIDELFFKLPIVGIIFRRSYAFWRGNIAVANLTHILLGVGLVLLFFEKVAIGLVLLAFAALMRIIAFIISGR